MPTKSALPLARRADVAGFGMPEHHGDGSALPMLVQSGNLSLEIWSSGGCRFTKRWSTIVIGQSKFTRKYSFKDDIMSKDSPITYHLQELAIARNQKSPFHAMPRFSENDTAILDIGCGIGQTLVASSLENGKLLVGIDIDLDSLIYGQRQFGYINFVNGTAECLPFQSESFDFVIARVSLPYTNIPKSLGEIRRVLKKDGKVWITLIAFPQALGFLKNSMLRLQLKSVVFRTYVIVNGIYFHIFGKQFAFPVYGRYESFQTESAIMKAMENAGFRNPTIQRERRFIVIAQK